ncbi:hypothetical protein RJD23_01500 [Buchnera aphidicola (Ceratoglyphina bambusae)]|uniref:hypothetical protein n=1 Tax=Buchnera aphidicola TaxID=9 RepID=UPI0031B8A79F
MKKIYSIEKNYINFTKNVSFFFLLGNETILINESIKKICKKLKKKRFLLKKNIEIKEQNKKKIFNFINHKSMFNEKKIIFLYQKKKNINNFFFV